MKIFLPKFAKEKGLHQIEIQLNDRLPAHVVGPCLMRCDLSAQFYEEDYYILSLKTNANIILSCQRCLQAFSYEYKNQVELAVCDEEQTAEKLMSHYECMVINNYHLDMIEVLTDDLHLNLPEKHVDFQECDREMVALMNDIS
ncbi:YceD family protein [Legionella impletisoli]|uniref:Large ribosomal RNA subunit accumulation protein YceD n=1 Tax=Legionella impletisoli TaxID=343510 RepID=A0A917JXC4_9GAMM|nr:YceD family protein [Legionella impletisoli]GGI91341.1 hypothetical protein GCM10007966_20050 [Legionella impletisoli]